MIQLFELGTLSLLEPHPKATIVASLVEALVEANRLYIRAKKPPPLYMSGVLYSDQPAWKDIPQALADKNADCKGLSAWLIAELREKGREATVHIDHYVLKDKDVFHVNVLVNGKVEDPSKILGMKNIVVRG